MYYTGIQRRASCLDVCMTQNPASNNRSIRSVVEWVLQLMHETAAPDGVVWYAFAASCI